MQYLEGPCAGMARLYEHILADRLRSGSIELVREPNPARELSDWTMAFRLMSVFGMSSPVKFDDLFIAKIDPSAAAPSVTHSLLLKVLEQRAAADAVQRDLVAQRLRRQATGGRQRIDRAASRLASTDADVNFGQAHTGI